MSTESNSNTPSHEAEPQPVISDMTVRNGLLREIELREVLSFGPEGVKLPLRALNVFIGPNGSGKSNLIECLALIRSSVRDLHDAVIHSGGAAEWTWKGTYPHQDDERSRKSMPFIRLVTVRSGLELSHSVRFLAFSKRNFRLIDEKLAANGADWLGDVYNFNHGKALLKTSTGFRELRAGDFDFDQSILSQFRDSKTFYELSVLQGAYDRIAFYREWVFGRNTVFRTPQQADMRNDRLEEDFSNLGMFLNRLRQNPKAKADILLRLQDLYEGITDFDVSVEAGTVQVFFTEGDFVIPATRLSDGSLRYLCLLAILCDPNPPPVICMEEPELGLHPDIIPKIADLLKEASTRCQLFVTTHSDILVDALSDEPDSVVVCEKHDSQTTMKRVDPTELKPWLEKYRLGQLWTRGQIGGTRW